MNLVDQLVDELHRDPLAATRLADALVDAVNPDRRFTATEMAPRLRANAKTVERWCREGRIPSAEKVGRFWMMPADATVVSKAPLTAATGHRSSRVVRGDDAGGQALQALKPPRRRAA